MFDAYGNHAMEGSEVQINVEGFKILDHLGLKRKVRTFVNFLARLCYHGVILKAQFQQLNACSPIIFPFLGF